MIVKGRKMSSCACARRVEYLIVQVIIFVVIPTTFLSWDGWRWSVGVQNSLRRVVEHLHSVVSRQKSCKKAATTSGAIRTFPANILLSTTDI